MYAIVNTVTKQISYYTSEHAASEACRVYNVLPGHSVYIINFAESQIEQL
jgi:hypothetical protein